MKNLTVILILFTLSLQDINGQDWTNKLDSVLLILADKQLFHGQVLIAEKDKILFSKAYGNHENNQQNSSIKKTSPLPIASVTKPFTAMGIMILKEQGKLNYDDKVIKYLPQIPYQEITIRHLLNQTSGIPRFLSTAMVHGDTTGEMSNDEIIELISKIKPSAGKIGEEFSYNNSNYILLASIIEKVSGMSYENFMMDNIWKPLGMNNTFNITSINSAKLKEEKVNADNFYNPYGEGSIYSTAKDLFRFHQALRSNTLVHQESIDEAFSKPTLNNGTKSRYGFGWFIEESAANKSVHHFGDGEFVGAYFQRFLTEDKALIILHVYSNIYADKTYWVIRNIWEGKEYELPVKRTVHKINPELYSKYVGSYLSPMGLFHISIENGELYLRPDPIPDKEKLIPSSDTTFYFENQDLEWQFYKDEDGEVIGFGIKGDKNNMGIKQE